MLSLDTFVLDTHARRLECCSFQWYGKDKPLGSFIFCCSHDIWELRSLQSSGRHLGGRVFIWGKFYSLSIKSSIYIQFDKFYKLYILAFFLEFKSRLKSYVSSYIFYTNYPNNVNFSGSLQMLSTLFCR